MWSLSMHAAEFVARAVLVYFAIMLLVRLSGKRTIGEFTAFDMVVVLLIGEATQGALTGGDESVGGALIVCATLVLLNYGTAFLGSRFALFDKLIEGEPVVLVRHGRLPTKPAPQQPPGVRPRRSPAPQWRSRCRGRRTGGVGDGWHDQRGQEKRNAVSVG
jgi:hypothetical protein